MRVFIIECPNPMDILQDRAEYQGLEKICKLIGHEVFSFLLKSKDELVTVCKYISTIDIRHDLKKDKDSPLCIHLSSHGNEDGLEFGKDFVDWSDLFWILQPIIVSKRFPASRIFIISACGANRQTFTKALTEGFKKRKGESYKPPSYLFVIDEEKVFWEDAVLAWTILYHQIPRIDLDDKKSVQDILRRMKQAHLGNLTYYRWDSLGGRFKIFRPE